MSEQKWSERLERLCEMQLPKASLSRARWNALLAWADELQAAGNPLPQDSPREVTTDATGNPLPYYVKVQREAADRAEGRREPEDRHRDLALRILEIPEQEGNVTAAALLIAGYEGRRISELEAEVSRLKAAHSDAITDWQKSEAQLAERDTALKVAEQGIRAIAVAFEQEPEFANLGKVDIDQLVAMAVSRIRAERDAAIEQVRLYKLA